MRNRSIKARLSAAEDRRISAMADRAGLTKSEFVRILISREEDSSRIDDVLDQIKSTLSSQNATSLTNLEPLIFETLLLLRELTSERNAQVLSRVNHKLDQVYGQGRVRA
jgi:hypothetical protein